MDTTQITCALKNVGVKSCLGVFPSDLLPSFIPQHDCTVIVNADPHTKGGSHWLAIHFEPRTSKAFYFDSFGQKPYISNIQDLIRNNSTVQEYNTVRLQGLTTTLCGQYCCLFPYTWTGVTRRSISSPPLTQPSQTTRSGAYSNLNSVHCTEFVFVVGRAAPPRI